MDKKSIEDKIRQIISDRLEVKAEKISLESKLRDDLGIDSFGLVELSFEIKDKFGIKIEDSDFPKILKVRDAVDYIYNKVKES
jgi:acyl carrier protein